MAYTRFSMSDPVVFFSEDLHQLEAALHEQVECKGCNMVIHATVDDHDISAKPFHSLEDLFQADFPSTIDGINIDGRSVDDGKIIKNIRVHLDKNMVFLHVYNATDNEWVTSNFTKLVEFFQKRRPWYGGIGKVIPPLFNMTMVLCFILAWWQLNQGMYSLLAVTGVLLVFVLCCLVLSVTKKIFPYTRIHLYPRTEDKRPPYERMIVISWVILVVIAFGGTLLI